MFCSDIEAAEAQRGVMMPDLELIKPASNGEYLGKIRSRLEEDSSARKEREKRRRKVLVDQLKAHEAQEVYMHSFQFVIYNCCSIIQISK